MRLEVWGADSLVAQVFLEIWSCCDFLETLRSPHVTTWADNPPALTLARSRFAVGLTVLTLSLFVVPAFSADKTTVNTLVSPAVEISKDLPLAESERVYLADIEHRALTLAKKGFPAFKSALHDEDLAKVLHFFSPTFRGRILEFDSGTGPQSRVVNVRRASANMKGSSDVNATGEEFARFLLSKVSQFAPDLQFEMKLLDMAPVQRENFGGPWQGNCNLRLFGKHRDGGPAETFFKLEFDFLRITDVDEIAKDSGWIQSLRVTEGYEALAKQELFKEVGKERGIDRELFWDNWQKPVEQSTAVTGGVYLADIDGDGWDDILITDINGVFLFRHNEDGRFTEISERAGLPHKLRGVINAVFGDFDQDGLPDLILDNRIFRNTGGGKFEDITRRCNLRFGNLLYLSGYTVGDYDKDGLLDIYVSRSYGPSGRNGKNSWIDGPGGPGNQLWRNLGDWKFEDVSDKANARAGRRSSFTSAWLDANNDGFPDIYVINEFGGGVLLVNTGKGTFTEQPLIKNDVGDFGSMGLAVADINNDGNIDIYTANMYSKSGRRIVGNLASNAYSSEVITKMKRFFPGSEMYRNRGGLNFEAAGDSLHVRAVGWAYGPTFFDLDNDGFLDIYATSGFTSVNKDEPDG